MPPHQKPLRVVAITLLVVGIGLYAYMTGPVNLIARPVKGSDVGYPILDG